MIAIVKNIEVGTFTEGFIFVKSMADLIGEEIDVEESSSPNFYRRADGGNCSWHRSWLDFDSVPQRIFDL